MEADCSVNEAPMQGAENVNQKRRQAECHAIVRHRHGRPVGFTGDARPSEKPGVFSPLESDGKNKEESKRENDGEKTGQSKGRSKGQSKGQSKGEGESSGRRHAFGGRKGEASMNASESTESLLRDQVGSDDRLVNLCRMTRGNPAFKPLVFEALLRTDMLVWLDQSASMHGLGSQGLSFEDSDWLPIRRLRYPEGGVAEYAAAFFTDKAHFNAYVRTMEPAQRQCCLPHDNQAVLNAVVTHRLPLVIDPGSPHHVYLTADQVRDWVRAVEPCHRQPAALPRSREFQAWAAAPLLVERLGAYLGQFEAIERAWVCRLGDREPRLGEGGTLLIEDTQADCHRIRCALPLISYGLTRMQALNWIVPLDRPIHEMPPQRRHLLTPVYDRGMQPRRWRGPRVWP